MATTIEQIEAEINLAVASGFRGRLMDRGEARSMIWRDGQLPVGSPSFMPTLSYDLFSYAYALLGLGLRLREAEGNGDTARRAFERAAMALESLLVKGARAEDARSFHFVIAAAAYHLGRFSARAYSLLLHGLNDENFSPIERCLSYLILRNLDALESEIITWRVNGPGTDEAIAAELQERWDDAGDDGALPENNGESYVADALGSAIIDTYLAGMGLFIFALERGDRAFVDQAIERLKSGLEVCAEVNLLPQWWSFRLTLHIIDDLWSSSFYEQLPLLPQDKSDSAQWSELRARFIALLYRRERAEVDLWPSQLAAAEKAIDESQDLVVSLPTSAGKTRIAELCILRCLAAGRRVVFITPLRALSAQTETTLHRTFIPLGKSISTLYGSIGTSEFESNALGSRDIVVGTPEKLDFALRNDPSLLDDVGLIILDEGHMIGLSEREVRYEVQIQRLLSRNDASTRRIVCLSAILPEGDELEDFVAWLSQDHGDSLVQSKWRPTRLRFGEVTWANGRGRLQISVGNENPFVPNFLTAQSATIGTRSTPFPRDQRELVLATSWRMAEEGQSVLIYCPERRGVEPYAREIVRLHNQGLVSSLLGGDQAKLARALAIGKEWLGEGHPILKCLTLGIAIHHGALSTAFRKEIEQLLRDGVLKVTVSSPTLAQGLNLSATAIVLHGIIRRGEPIEVSEFKNVIGRAGRAFVDIEGLVLFPQFERNARRSSQWARLRDDAGAREMESGLLLLITTFLLRIRNQRGGTYAEIAEYVLNNAQAWDFVALPSESVEAADAERRTWQQHLTTLDTAILSLVGEHDDIPDDQVAARVDDILSSSLWERRLARRSEEVRSAYQTALRGRVKFLWANSTGAQRRSYFLAGVGYETGKLLDAAASAANALLVDANGKILTDDNDGAIAAITALAETLFEIPPFTPKPLPTNWRDILASWLKGESVGQLAEGDPDFLRFVEDGLVYRLPWGMEALRVRALANGDTLEGGYSLDDYELGLAVPAVETGTLDRSAAILMQAGFTSRLGAIKAVNDGDGNFENYQELKTWLASPAILEFGNYPQWPTPETAEIWRSFLDSFTPPDKAKWLDWTWSCTVNWSSEDKAPASGAPIRLVQSPDDPSKTLVLSPDHEMLGTVVEALNPKRKGLIRADVKEDRAGVAVRYVGPPDLIPGQLA